MSEFSEVAVAVTEKTPKLRKVVSKIEDQLCELSEISRAIKDRVCSIHDYTKLEDSMINKESERQGVLGDLENCSDSLSDRIKFLRDLRDGLFEIV